jgi:hypothetical protein
MRLSPAARPRLTVSLLAGSALVALAAYGLWPTSPAPATHPARVDAAAPAAPVERPPPVPQKGRWSRYRITTDARAYLDGRVVGRERLEGAWTTTDRTLGRTEGRLVIKRLEMTSQQPPAQAAAAAPFVFSAPEGVLSRVGFAAATPLAARDLLTSVAATFQHTIRPGAAWTVDEEDLTGTYPASYTRSGDHITRTRCPAGGATS